MGLIQIVQLSGTFNYIKRGDDDHDACMAVLSAVGIHLFEGGIRMETIWRIYIL